MDYRKELINLVSKNFIEGIAETGMQVSPELAEVLIPVYVKTIEAAVEKSLEELKPQFIAENGRSKENGLFDSSSKL